MRDLIEYACKAMDMLDSIGVRYGNIIDFTVNTTAKKRWGQCRKVPGGYEININAVLLFRFERYELQRFLDSPHRMA